MRDMVIWDRIDFGLSHIMEKPEKAVFARIEMKKCSLDKARPLPQAVLLRLREEIAIEWTYNSNAIEGNSLSLRETRLVLEEGATISGKPLREHFEATNHRDAIVFLESLLKEQKLTEHNILDIHAVVLKNIEADFAGRYRQGQVRIMGASIILPNFMKVPTLMNELVAWVNANPDELDSVTLAATFHYKFVAIHPFFDGNGRTARLLMNLLLMRKGYPPVVVPVVDRKKYYSVLEMANGGNLQPFIDLMASYVERGLDVYLRAIGADNEELLRMKDLAPLTPYSANYLSLLASRNDLEATKRGKTWFASKEAVDRYIKTHSG